MSDRIQELERQLVAAQNELCTAKDQIPPDLDGDSLSVALIKLKDARRMLTQERDEHKRWRAKLADDLHDRETELYALTRKYDAEKAVAEAHEEVLTRERDRYRDLLEGKP